MAEVRRTRQITKSELRTLKKRVAQLRKKGFDVWTDDELEREGWTLAPLPPAAADAATPSVAQAADWDCGLACVQMALLSLDVPPPACSLKQLRARLSSDSVWTADLVYLLASYGIQCEYLTSELSAGASSAEKADSAFYASSLEADAARVDALFARAASEEGVSIRCCKLGANELWNALRDDDQLAIVLVDGRMLYARAGRPPDGDFEGHYVLLVGLDDTTDSFRVKDPARSDRTAVVAAKASLRAAPPPSPPACLHSMPRSSTESALRTTALRSATTLSRVQLSARRLPSPPHQRLADARAVPGTDDDVILVPLSQEPDPARYALGEARDSSTSALERAADGLRLEGGAADDEPAAVTAGR